MKLEFLVRGRPIPQGGLRIVLLPDGSRILAPNNSAKLNPWRKKVKKAAEAAMREAGLEPFSAEIPLSAQMQFCFVKPRTSKFASPTYKNDVDKLERAILDALTGTVFADDGQVVRALGVKRYGDFERVEIRVEAALASMFRSLPERKP